MTRVAFNETALGIKMLVERIVERMSAMALTKMIPS